MIKTGDILKCPNPPILTVSDLTPLTAIIEMDTDCESASSKRIRYRLMDGIDGSKDDDEKEAKWNEIDIEPEMTRHKLIGLTPNAWCEVRGQYYAADSHIWSEWSESLTFSTPKTWPFEWDPARTHEELKLSKYWQRFTMTSTGWIKYNNRSLCSRHPISADFASSVTWELTMKEKGDDGLYLLIGFIDGQHIDKFDKETMIGLNENEVALEIWDGHSVKIKTNGKKKKTDFDGKIASKVGDCFRLNFNLISRECYAFYNEEPLGLVTESLPQEIYMACTLDRKDISFETTLFDVRPLDGKNK